MIKILFRKNKFDKKEIKFFKKNEEKINKIFSLLQDKKSKKTYKKILKLHCFKGNTNICNSYVNTQYFPRNIIKLSNNETFVDCGACNGDTVLKFIKKNKNKYKKIIAFEANFNNFKILEKWKKRIDNMSTFNLALCNKKSKSYFLLKTNLTSKLILKNKKNFKKNKNYVIVQTEKIDNIKDCANMTLLKMDIEGAELKALIGSKNTIRKNKPKMAISIYHSYKDLINIAWWIINLNMNYKLYIRHYSKDYRETILYAI